MHKTIDVSAQPNRGSKTKIFLGAAPDPITGVKGSPQTPY